VLVVDGAVVVVVAGAGAVVVDVVDVVDVEEVEDVVVAVERRSDFVRASAAVVIAMAEMTTPKDTTRTRKGGRRGRVARSPFMPQRIDAG
jgi:hypothetical protein